MGGCNGCLNVNNPDNAGLEDVVEALETAYVDNSISSLMSRFEFNEIKIISDFFK